MSNFIVDTDFKNLSTRISQNFPTKAEAVTHAARMALDSQVAWSGVRGFGLDADIDEASLRKRLDELRNKFQNLHYQRIDYEKTARQLKRDGDKQQEAAAWEIARRISMAEHSAESEYKVFQKTMREYGVKP